jgi:vacuolar-type H+-ATPase subunit I/STV1
LDKCLFEDDQSDNDNSEYTCQDETGLLLRDFIRDGKVFPIAEKNKSDYIPIIVMTSDKNPEKQNLHLEKNTRAIVKTPHTILLSGMRILDEEINKYVQQLKGDNDMEMAKNIDNSINIYDSNNVQIQKDTRNSTQTFKFVIKNEDIKKLKNECNELLNNLNYSNTDNLELGAEINKLNQNLNSDSISKENILTHIEKISNIINTFKSNNPETIALITEYAPVLWDYCSKFIG